MCDNKMKYNAQKWKVFYSKAKKGREGEKKRKEGRKKETLHS